MKKSIAIGMAVLFILLLFSCSNKTQRQTDYTAKDLLQKLYTVDSGTSKKYSTIIKMKHINSSVIDSIYSKFKTDMAAKDYSTFIQNDMYMEKVDFANKNNCTFSCKGVSLTNAQKGDSTVQYDYSVKVLEKLKNNKEKSLTGEGTIQVVKQKNVWMVNWIRITDDSNFFKI